jgi:hypothetical protein
MTDFGWMPRTIVAQEEAIVSVWSATRKLFTTHQPDKCPITSSLSGANSASAATFEQKGNQNADGNGEDQNAPMPNQQMSRILI